MINSTVFESSTGVRQDSAISGSLFTLYINESIRAENSYGHDGFLRDYWWMTPLTSMDDTVIFATSRNAMLRKLSLLEQVSDALGVKIHPTKSLYIEINTPDHNSSILEDNIVIKHTQKYTYRRNIITNEKVIKQVCLNTASKEKHL